VGGGGGGYTNITSDASKKTNKQQITNFISIQIGKLTNKNFQFLLMNKHAYIHVYSPTSSFAQLNQAKLKEERLHIPQGHAQHNTC
jgi:purine nucleoside phosphorylase